MFLKDTLQIEYHFTPNQNERGCMFGNGNQIQPRKILVSDLLLYLLK